MRGSYALFVAFCIYVLAIIVSLALDKYVGITAPWIIGR